jgi:hypothetical protein
VGRLTRCRDRRRAVMKIMKFLMQFVMPVAMVVATLLH